MFENTSPKYDETSSRVSTAEERDGRLASLVPMAALSRCAAKLVWIFDF